MKHKTNTVTVFVAMILMNQVWSVINEETTTIGICRRSFSDSNGYIRSLSSTNCSYVIEVQSAESLTLTFSDVDYDCPKRRITVTTGGYSVYSANHGNLFYSSTIISYSNYFELLYEGCDWVDQKGSIHYSANETCNKQFSDPDGIVMILHPFHFTRAVDCSWKIDVAEAHSVTLVFTDIGFDCENDSMEVYSGQEKNKSLLFYDRVADKCQQSTEFSANTSSLKHVKSTVTSYSNSVLILLTTGQAFSTTGFVIYYFSDVPCKGTFKGKSDYIVSPYFPSSFKGTASCVYNIAVPDTVLLTIDFHKLKIDCQNDVFNIYNGHERGEGSLLYNSQTNGCKPSSLKYYTNALMIYYETKQSSVVRWFTLYYEAKECRMLTNPSNGSVTFAEGTSDVVEALYKCDKGFQLVGSATRQCIAGVWVDQAPFCKPLDCGKPDKINNGNAVYTATTFGSVIAYTCKDSYVLTGQGKGKCSLIDNKPSWDFSVPSCVPKMNDRLYCPKESDSRNFVWNEIIAESVSVQPCQSGSTGTVSRRCMSDGRWEAPVFHCVRESIEQLRQQVLLLTNTSSLSHVIDNMVNVSTVTESTVENNLPTGAEINIISQSLNAVALALRATETAISDNDAEKFMQSASNLVDQRNQETWVSLRETNFSAAERVLSAMDSFGNAIASRLEKTGVSDLTIVKPNIAVEIQTAAKEDIVFPRDLLSNTDEWHHQLGSQIRLPKESFNGLEKNFSTAAVLYRNISSLLSDMQGKQKVNGPVLSLSLSPEVYRLDSPVLIMFRHFEIALTNPVCTFWEFSSEEKGHWSEDGCILRSTNASHSVCECNHLTNFAILMSPFVEATKESRGLQVVSLVGISLSLVCLVITVLVYLILWRFVRNSRAILLMNLSVALILAYVVFLAGIDSTENEVGCKIISVILHYMLLVVFCLMLAEGLDLLITIVVVFSTDFNKIKKLLVFAWGVPLAIVCISLAATQSKGYGDENYCWLSVQSGLIWAFVGPALTIIVINAICLATVLKTMYNTKSMRSKMYKEKIVTSARSLGVLIPVTGVAWVLGIFYVDQSSSFMQYIFSLCNALQGVFIFIFHCVFNAQVRKGVLSLRRKQSANMWKSSSESTKMTTMPTAGRYARRTSNFSKIESEDNM